LKHRFSSETLWSLNPFIVLLEKKKGKILDLGCGAGHASYLINKFLKPELLILADYDYSLIYLARAIACMYRSVYLEAL